MLLLELPLEVGFLMLPAELEVPVLPEEREGVEEADEPEELDLPRPETMSCAERPEEAEEEVGVAE